MQHFNKYGIAAFMFFLGTALPAVAQEEVTEEVHSAQPAAQEVELQVAFRHFHPDIGYLSDHHHHHGIYGLRRLGIGGAEPFSGGHPSPCLLVLRQVETDLDFLLAVLQGTLQFWFLHVPDNITESFW